MGRKTRKDEPMQVIMVGADGELAPWQIDALARPLVGMIDEIVNFYRDPENQRRFNAWCLQKYGKTLPLPDGVEDKTGGARV